MPLVVYKPYYQRNWPSVRRLPPVRGGHHCPSTLLCRKATVLHAETEARGSGQRSLSLRTRRRGCETCRCPVADLSAPMRGLSPYI